MPSRYKTIRPQCRISGQVERGGGGGLRQLDLSDGEKRAQIYLGFAPDVPGPKLITGICIPHVTHRE